MDSHCFKLHWSYFTSLICQMLAKLSGLNQKWPYVSLEKEKQNFCVVLTYSIRWVREIRKFHVAVVQSNFANLNLLVFFFCSQLLLQKLLIVAIQKFCYHGDMMSHFFFLLRVALIEYSVYRVCHTCYMNTT